MADPEEDPTPEDTEEAAPEEPRGTIRYYGGADPYALPSVQELKVAAKEIGQNVVDRVGEETVEIFTQPARATADNVMARIRNGIKAFLAPTVSALPCEATTKKGKVCGRSPCPYPSHIEDGE